MTDNPKNQNGLLADVPATLSALTRAVKLQERAARVGFDWTQAETIFEKLDEEVAELKTAMREGNPADITDELGDVLFVIANLARHLKIDPETALHGGSQKFSERFAYMEAHGDLTAATLPEMEMLWAQAKRALAASASPTKKR